MNVNKKEEKINELITQLREIAPAELEGLKRKQISPIYCNPGDDYNYVHCECTIEATDSDPAIGHTEAWDDEFNDVKFELTRLTENLTLFYTKKYIEEE
mgnify:CR=1 FL=1